MCIRDRSGLEQIIRTGFSKLGLISYFTAGVQEVRSWTIKNGSKAPQAAGVIHNDFEKGFIRAETIAYEDFIKYGGEAKAKEAGVMRSEGKDYIVQDGDVIHFRFNVWYFVLREIRFSFEAQKLDLLDSLLKGASNAWIKNTTNKKWGRHS